jgi:hypothetical protein
MSWQIFPKKGLGELRFGMSPAEVEFFAGIYGKLDQIVGSSDLSASVEETIRLFGSDFSESDIAALRKQAAEQAAAATLTEIRSSGALALDYEKNRLVSIMISAELSQALFSGRPVFAMPNKELIELLERENGSAGRYRFNEAAFDQIAISLNGFTKLVSQTDFELLADDDPMASEKTITLREKPYISGEPGYQVISAF